MSISGLAARPVTPPSLHVLLQDHYIPRTSIATMGATPITAKTTLANIPQAPEDPLYSLVSAYEADTSPNKVDLGVGAYRDDNAKPWILPSVRKAEEIVYLDRDRNHEYLPISGLPEFNSAAQKLILGAKSPAISEKRVTTFQSISGTGPVHLGGVLLQKFLPKPTPAIYISNPSWPIHEQCFQHCGLEVKYYPYFDRKNNAFDFEGMMNTLHSAPEGSVILLHACAHNPTGEDPSQDQWKTIAVVMRKRSLFPFFDCAYQGFASGSLEDDAFAIRLFVDAGFEMCICQSFAKNMGLYGQRAGAFHYISAPGPEAESVVKRVASQLAIIVRSEMSSPPIYGAKIAATILNDEGLFGIWEEDLRTVSDRIKEMRKVLRDELEKLETPGSWEHITRQIGMFSFTGLSEGQVMELRRKWHVYCALTGRVSVAGLNSGNVEYFARAVDDVVKRIA